jgi:ArsR family transcriptional regulator, virulence genes transcriptional regulator
MQRSNLLGSVRFVVLLTGIPHPSNMDADTPDFEAAARLFTVAASAPRLRILCALQDRELSVTELSELLGLEHSPVSQHLRWLRDAGLVRMRRERTFSYYSLTGDLADRLLLFLYRNFGSRS